MAQTRELLLLLRISAVLLSVLACLGCQPGRQAVNAVKEDPAASGFAVVELFTSEGCSSCPPADALLNCLADEARKNDNPIYCLAFHVDYFNHLGWVDKLSDAAYTRRQEWYGKRSDNAEIYTPMMIVNGGDPFLGYDEATARERIGRALHASQSVLISLTVQQISRGGLHLGYRVKGAASGDRIQVAIIESGLGRKITGGENRGKSFVNECVVRGFKSEAVGTDGKGSMDFDPIKLDGGKLESVVAFLQSDKSGEIRGVAKASLNGGK